MSVRKYDGWHILVTARTLRQYDTYSQPAVLCVFGRVCTKQEFLELVHIFGLSSSKLENDRFEEIS